MKRFVMILFLCVALLGFYAQNSFADAHHAGKGEKSTCACEMGMPDGMHDGHMGKMMHKRHIMWKHLMALDLSDKQREAVKEIRSKVEKDTIRKRADIQVAGVELREMLGKDQVDMDKVEATLKQIAALKTDMHLAHIKAFVDIKSKLTPEQREQFRKSMWKHGEGKGCGKGPHDKKEKMRHEK
jgi:Spy/CpxP family protein refolding chaperone